VEISQIIAEYGFPVIMSMGMAYFIYYVWNFINDELDPKIGEMHIALIRVIDKTRMLDQDMIRLKSKIEVVMRYKNAEKMLNDDKPNGTSKRKSG
jgi:hypothetical protein|tara:strand:- start:519 stop:803 length:285 start_codon:yes stop_codon:yes gene_type:complete